MKTKLLFLSFLLFALPAQSMQQLTTPNKKHRTKLNELDFSPRPSRDTPLQRSHLLMLAIADGDTQKVAELCETMSLEEFAECHTFNYENPFHLAVKHCTPDNHETYREIIAKLNEFQKKHASLTDGLLIDDRDDKGNTALMISESADATIALLECDANINVQERTTGRTVAMLSLQKTNGIAEGPHYRNLVALITHGADLTIRTLPPLRNNLAQFAQEELQPAEDYLRVLMLALREAQATKKDMAQPLSDWMSLNGVN